ncbi:MAG: FkbM family methyltransferase [Verrucomicrobiaceae bacterium]|nr:FkbM family methyltransferase [Verrucomicrobiaceae bacterium]
MTLTYPDFIQDFLTRWHFKFTLPAKRRAKLHGVKLDISRLSPLMKNHILQDRYEFQERRLALRCLTRKDVVLELGGAIGFIGLFCRKVIGVRHHVTVEPNPNTLAMLKRNYALNKLEPRLIEAAASAEDGEISLDIGGEFWENSIVTASDSSKRITVPSLSLPSIIRRMPEPPTALICDIEGAEAYLDFTQLPKSVTRIIIELHPGIVGEDVAKRVVEQIYTLGFHTRAVEENTWLFMR